MTKGGGLGLFLFYFLSAMWSTWLISRTQTRQDIVWAIGPLLLGLFALWAGATLMGGGAYNRYLPEALATIGGGIFSMLLTFALAPVVEMVFGYTTRFRLMELMNLEQPILRELMLNAPGTYHHSLIVSNMVEAGAKAIGAHSLLCKVAALYHDIGKIPKAGYFIENQFTAENPHDRLSPSMSALVLLSHTKRGEELGIQHNLGREVTGIIRQHHGTGVIRYFYQKALQMADPDNTPKIEDFSYPGPKPQSREAALVMLADAVEASSRILGDPSPSRLRAHIDTVMKGIFADGQLDESEMTFRDLDRVADSFHRILTGMFHHRIEYPDRQRPGSLKAAPRAPEPPSRAQVQLPDGTPAGIIGEEGAGAGGTFGNIPGEAVRPASPPLVVGSGKPRPDEAARGMNGGTVDWTTKPSGTGKTLELKVGPQPGTTGQPSAGGNGAGPAGNGKPGQTGAQPLEGISWGSGGLGRPAQSAPQSGSQAVPQAEAASLWQEKGQEPSQASGRLVLGKKAS